MTQNAITIKNLHKTYKATGKSAAKTALETIDLAIPRGSMFALLGPNGAGKSTLINILSGLVTKTSGTVEIWGVDVDRDAKQSRAAMGVVPQEVNFDPFFSPRALLELQAGMYGVPKNERRTHGPAAHGGAGGQGGRLFALAVRRHAAAADGGEGAGA